MSIQVDKAEKMEKKMEMIRKVVNGEWDVEVQPQGKVDDEESKSSDDDDNWMPNGMTSKHFKIEEKQGESYIDKNGQRQTKKIYSM